MKEVNIETHVIYIGICTLLHVQPRHRFFLLDMYKKNDNIDNKYKK